MSTEHTRNLPSRRHVHPMLWGIGRRLLVVALVATPLWLAVWAAITT